MSGSPLALVHNSLGAGVVYKQTLSETDAASSCNPGNDGTRGCAGVDRPERLVERRALRDRPTRRGGPRL